LPAIRDEAQSSQHPVEQCRANTIPFDVARNDDFRHFCTADGHVSGNLGGTKMVAIMDSVQEGGARTVGSLATNVAGRRISGAQRLVEVNPDQAEVVYLIANDCQVRERLVRDLALSGVIVRSFASAHEYFHCPRRKAAACIIAELQQEEISSWEIQRQLIEKGGPPIIFIGTQMEMLSGIRAIKAGALDFLIHPLRPEELCCALSEAFMHHRISRQRQNEVSALHAHYISLTRREREVFALVVQGLLNKQVAGMLAISLVTVQIHRGNTMRKMGARSFADLVCMALKLRILEKDLDANDSSRRMQHRYARPHEHEEFS
jgi:FixJ family two-component response regulator